MTTASETGRDILREELFRPYLPGKGPFFRVTTWDPHLPLGSHGHTYLGYELVMYENGQRTVLFTGTDYGIPSGEAIDSDESIRGLMGFLTLRPGDTDAEYFEKYTPEQFAFADAHGESLSCEVTERFGEG